jgi:hypothetical protein
LLAFLPGERVIRDRQETYCSALAESDHRADGAPFIEFMPAAPVRIPAGGRCRRPCCRDQANAQANQVVKTLSGREMGPPH